MSMTTREASDVIRELADKYRAELTEEKLEDEVVSGQSFDDEVNELAVENLTTLNLASVPVHAWGSLRVSKISKFADIKWDWRKEGSPLYRDNTVLNWDVKIDGGLSLISEAHTPLISLLRALLFYWLPQNAVFTNVRSFNTTLMAGRSVLYLGRFLITMGAYVDERGDDRFKVANDLDPACFRDYCEKISIASNKLSFVRHVRHWWRLSQAGLLPAQYQLNSEVFDEAALSNAHKLFEESKTPYQPVTLETLSTLIPHCIEIIENHADDIIFAYELFLPVISGESKSGFRFDWHAALLKLEQRKASLWDMQQLIDTEQTMSHQVSQKLCREIRRQPAWRNSPNYRSARTLYRAPRETLKNIAFELGIDLGNFDKSIFYDAVKVRFAVINMATTLRTACAVILLLVTGMRRSELANLEAGNYWKSHDGTGGYRLRFFIFKPSEASQGDEHEIPIPLIAYKALCLMERLSLHARRIGGNNLLFASATVSFGRPIRLSAINRFLDRWCEELGLGEPIHPHQFRKTLAMFLIYQDAGNLPLIKRLFGHKSLKMSLAYITKLPGIAREVKLALLEQNMELIGELLGAASKGVIAGRAGSRLKETVRSGRYAAMLNDGGWETLEQYVDSLLEEGIFLLHRTPLEVICTKTPAVDQPAPCDAPFAPKIRRLHPNVQNCQPHGCKYAAFTETSVPGMLNDIKAHRLWLKHPYARSDQKQFSKEIIESSLSTLSELGFSEDGERLAADSAERIA